MQSLIFFAEVQVRLTFMTEDPAHLMVDADAHQLTLPSITAPDGQTLRGWAKQEQDETGRTVMTIVFTPDENGALRCKLSNVEVMGRDSSVVSTHSASANPVVRSIINSDIKVDTSCEEIRFSLKPHKVFVFNKETEERIRFEVK